MHRKALQVIQEYQEYTGYTRSQAVINLILMVSGSGNTQIQPFQDGGKMPVQEPILQDENVKEKPLAKTSGKEKIQQEKATAPGKNNDPKKKSEEQEMLSGFDTVDDDFLMRMVAENFDDLEGDD